MNKKSILIVPRSPENAYKGFEGHGYYENFYEGISEYFDTSVLSTEYDEKRKFGNLNFLPYNTDNKIVEALSLVKNIVLERPDVVMTENASLTTVTAFTTAKLVGSKTVMKIEALPRDEDQLWLSSLLADGVSSVAQCVDDKLPIDSTVVYPGTDFPEEIEPRKFDEDKINVGFLGRFHHDKGIDRFIEVFEKTESEDIKFHVAGRGDYMKDYMKNLGWSESNFNFYSKIPTDDIFPYLAGLDVVLVPSRIEGCTRVVVECLYTGTPVIAWDIEPHREMIEDKDMLVDSVDEIVDLIEEDSFVKEFLWFDHSKYTVEAEIEGMSKVIKDTIEGK